MSDNTWRDEIVTALETGNAFTPWRDIIRDFPEDRINDRAPNVPYTFWQLLEHIRFAQWDIRDKLTNPDHQEPSWPRDYWPPLDKKVDMDQWRETIRLFADDLEALRAFVGNGDQDLLAPATPDATYTALSSILSLIEHNAYHFGEFAILRQVTGAWYPGH